MLIANNALARFLTLATNDGASSSISLEHFMTDTPINTHINAMLPKIPPQFVGWFAQISAQTCSVIDLGSDHRAVVNVLKLRNLSGGMQSYTTVTEGLDSAYSPIGLGRQIGAT